MEDNTYEFYWAAGPETDDDDNDYDGSPIVVVYRDGDNKITHITTNINNASWLASRDAIETSIASGLLIDLETMEDFVWCAETLAESLVMAFNLLSSDGKRALFDNIHEVPS